MFERPFNRNVAPVAKPELGAPRIEVDLTNLVPNEEGECVWWRKRMHQGRMAEGGDRSNEGLLSTHSRPSRRPLTSDGRVITRRR